jgi:hypothetical protein
MIYLEAFVKTVPKGKVLVFLLLYILVLVGCKPQKPIVIRPLHPYYQTDTVDMENGETCIRLSGNFTINCELKDSTRFRPIVDSFLNTLPDSLTKGYCVTTLWFYKEGEKLNPNYRSHGKEHPDLYNNDIIFEVHWTDGDFRGYSFYKDGLFWSQDSNVELVPVQTN